MQMQFQHPYHNADSRHMDEFIATGSLPLQHFLQSAAFVLVVCVPGMFLTFLEAIVSEMQSN
jgi:hypothetical protein